MKLVIIEGAGKKETIEKYLGDGYKVFATKGHVRDLPEKSLAVDVNNNFAPKYVIMDAKKDIVKDLTAKAGKAEEIFLATDPDREGEAISWHLSNILDIPADRQCRIVFNEISRGAVQAALKSPRAIDINLVNAQQARRVLDRLVGYKLSPVLCRKIQKNLSGGRVQSVTLKLVVDREHEIINFVPEEYWVLTAFLMFGESADAKDREILFKAVLSQKDGKKYKITKAEEMDAVLAELKSAEYKVESVKQSVVKSHAPAPFITSTMQQDALNKLGFSLKQTTQTAQELYEGVTLGGEGKVALVTYIRTDSTRVSKEAQDAAREFIARQYGDKYVPAKPNIYAGKKNAQDAHEAIRPIDLARTPEGIRQSVSIQVYKLYKLVYDRFLASQMAEAQYNQLTVDIAAGRFGFRAGGRTLLFDGYTAAYNNVPVKSKEEEDESGGNAKIPALKEGDRLDLQELKPEQKFTKPPARYTEASLVKAMEDKGIGRPATFMPTVTTLFSRKYVEKEGKAIMPTELGFKVTDLLVKYFPDIMDIKFTAVMETRLDDIEEGGTVWQDVVGDFYKDFEKELKEAQADDFSMKEPDQETDHVCEKCGSNMVIKTGRYGKFLACPKYPACKNIKNIDEEGNILEAREKDAGKPSGEKCEKCGGEMLIKTGRYGKFLGCANYPECRNMKSYNDPSEPVYVCPECGKDLAKRRNKRGSFFYGCSGYPDCNYIIDARKLEAAYAKKDGAAPADGEGK